MDKVNLKLLLTDYDERCTDLRRQLSDYPRLAIIMIVVIATSIGWVFGEGAFERLWVFSAMTILCQMLAVVAIFIYKFSAITRQYLFYLEAILDEYMPEKMKTHSIPGGFSGKIGFGFYRWKRLRCGENPLAHRVFNFLAVIFIIAVAIFFYMGMWDSLFDAWLVRPMVVFFAIFLTLVGVVLYYSIGPYTNYSLNKAKPNNDFFDFQDAISLLIVDYKQRNEDFRFISDFYPRLFISLLMVISVSLGVFYANPQKNEWIFCLAPFGLLILPIGMIYLVRQLKYIKIYLLHLENFFYSLQQEGMDSSVIPGDFQFGFFRFIRERHVAKTVGGQASFFIWLIKFFLAVSVISFSAYWSWRSYIWLGELGLTWLGVIQSIILFALVLLNLFFYWRTYQIKG